MPPTVWLKTFPNSDAIFIDTDSGQSINAAIREGQLTRLDRYASTGLTFWTTSQALATNGIAIDRVTQEFFIWGGATDEQSILHFDGYGSFRDMVDTCKQCQISDFIVGQDEEEIELIRHGGEASLAYRPFGRNAWSLSAPNLGITGASSFTWLAVAVTAHGGVSVQYTQIGASDSDTQFLLVLSNDGKLEHVHPLPQFDVLRISGITTTAENVIVVGTYSGTVRWAGTTLQSTLPSGILFAMDWTGQELWARDLGPERTQMRIDLDASTWITLAGGNTGCGGVLVDTRDQSGALVWSRPLEAAGCAGSIQITGLRSARYVMVAGTFTGAVDFGTGPLQADKSTGFLWAIEH